MLERRIKTSKGGGGGGGGYSVVNKKNYIGFP